MEYSRVGQSGLQKPILEIDNLTVIRSGKLVLRDINLNVQRGEFVGIVGPNGSGKSTLLLTILGVLKAQEGDVKIYDSEPMSRNLYGKIGWVSQAASNLPKEVRITIRELVHLGTVNAKNMFSITNNTRRKRVKEAIKMVGLEGLENVDIARLSGGQRQRAVIARALATEAEFILLDEPLVGMDRDSRNSLLKLLDQFCHDSGKTIIMVSHDLSAIRQTAHRMIFLEETIRFDGPSADFPDLESLALVRGITNVHDMKPQTKILPNIDKKEEI
ncbi:MAG: metal ABC transporter ATP-binding protein [Candidatus Poseidoniales archaeon]|nr:MAG: metal ABC transporter ATP-binding protein [Candidatus Poseidoniales archaeon]